MKILRGLAVFAFACGLSLAPSKAGAAFIDGTLNINGDVEVTIDAIDYLPIFGNAAFDFNVTGTSDGDFAPLAGTFGNLQDLDQNVHPVGSAFSFPDWLTFAASDMTFELQFIVPGVHSDADCFAPAAAGQTCTVAGSPFNLRNDTASSSTVSFAVRGVAIEPGVSDPSPFSGLFSTQFSNRNYQQLLAAINAGDAVRASYSANFLVVPEPGMYGALALGLSGLCLLASRRRRMTAAGEETASS